MTNIEIDTTTAAKPGVKTLEAVKPVWGDGLERTISEHVLSKAVRDNLEQADKFFLEAKKKNPFIDY